MRSIFALVVGTVFLLGTGVSLAQSGGMMNGGSWGGGGMWMWMWMPALFVVVVVALVVWVVKQKK